MFESLRITRLPGPYGPTLRCAGHLVRETVAELRQAISLVAPLGHPALTVDVSRVDELDSGGIATLLRAEEACRLQQVRFVLVTGTGRAARLISRLGLDQQMVIAESEEGAQAALEFLFGKKTQPERALLEAQRESLRQWRWIARGLDLQALEETARQLIEMHALCEHCEQRRQPEGDDTDCRCELCPLSLALGGAEADKGCTRTVTPILRALANHDPETAREKVREVIAQLETMTASEPRRSPD